MDGNDSSKMNFVANIGNYESPCGYCRSGASTSLVRHLSVALSFLSSCRASSTQHRAEAMTCFVVLSCWNSHSTYYKYLVRSSTSNWMGWIERRGEGVLLEQGMVANQITCEAYQDLLNRGWRRSGTWLYRSLAEDSECSCVPHTIRLDVHKFVPSRVSPCSKSC